MVPRALLHDTIKILYVDNHESNFWILEKKLKKNAEDFLVEWAKNTDESLTMLNESSFDCVIIDSDLDHGNNGFSHLEEVRNIYPHLPLILLSSQHDEEMVTQAFRLGVTDFFIRKIGVSFFQRLAYSIRNSVERFRAEAKKEHFEFLFNKAVENGPIPFILIDSTRQILFWNRACEEITGLKSDNVSGTDIYRRVFIPETGEIGNLADLILDGTIEEVVARSPYVKKSNMNSYKIEGYFALPGERKKFLRISASPVIDSSGQITAVIETVEDLTGIMKAREELAKRNKQMMELVKNSPVAMCIYQEDKMKLFNDKLASISGYTPADLERIDIWDLIHPEDLVNLKKYSEQGFNGEPVPDQLDFRGVTKISSTKKFIGYFTQITFDEKPAILVQLIESSNNLQPQKRDFTKTTIGV
jgi:PAS domain-containing protein